MLCENASDAPYKSSSNVLLQHRYYIGHPCLVSLLFIPSLYSTFFNSKNFLFTCNYSNGLFYVIFCTIFVSVKEKDLGNKGIFKIKK